MCWSYYCMTKRARSSSDLHFSVIRYNFRWRISVCRAFPLYCNSSRKASFNKVAFVHRLNICVDLHWTLAQQTRMLKTGKSSSFNCSVWSTLHSCQFSEIASPALVWLFLSFGNIVIGLETSLAQSIQIQNDLGLCHRDSSARKHGAPYRWLFPFQWLCEICPELFHVLVHISPRPVGMHDKDFHIHATL